MPPCSCAALQRVAISPAQRTGARTVHARRAAPSQCLLQTRRLLQARLLAPPSWRVRQRDGGGEALGDDARCASLVAEGHKRLTLTTRQHPVQGTGGSHERRCVRPFLGHLPVMSPVTSYSCVRLLAMAAALAR